MNDWIPILAGVVIIALAVGIIRFAPNSTWAQELRRPYGIRPTGGRGNRTRRDHLLGAGLGAVAAVALLATSVAASAVANRSTTEEGSGLIAETYMFVAALLGLMALTSTARSLWKAAVWRVELPDTPAHRVGLADAIDHLLDGELSPDERREFLEVRYLQPQIEQIRRATLKLARQHRAGMPEDFRMQIKRWTAGIRASAGHRE